MEVTEEDSEDRKVKETKTSVKLMHSSQDDQGQNVTDEGMS